ncbi:MAG: hypoxanthine phosphoribosyltransferase [Rikenellaceae bacterium]
MAEKVKICDRTFEVMIPATQIAESVERVAERLNANFTDEDNVVLLGILNGSFIFLSDLVRKLNFRVEISFVKIASYEGCNSTGEVREMIGLKSSVKGRKVVIVEDIVDTGHSITHITALLRAQKVASYDVCTLFFKPAAYQGKEEIKYRAMEIGNEFIVGYGLDYNELGRELADIYVTKC